MSFKECLDKGIITKTLPDKGRAKKMQQMADIRFEFWNKKVNEKFIALKVEAYYEIIKELTFANLYAEGLNCTNHLCLISYLKERIDNFDFEIDKIDELRTVRNEISYRGFFVGKDYLDRNELEFHNIINKLKINLAKKQYMQ